jgi:hypothetical protein
MLKNGPLFRPVGSAEHHRASAILLRRLFPLILLACVSGNAAADQTPVPTRNGNNADHPSASARDAAATDQSPDHAMGGMNAWSFGFDSVIFTTFNRQGRPRGQTQFASQNWLMASGTRRLPRGRFTVLGGLSAEPVTVQRAGYSELFQVGEAYKSLQVTDRQHPHDLLMQLAAVWRVPLGKQVSFTLAGGPVGEPALGPAAFIHRASSSENPTAPLSHHIFDSTHIAHGVLTMGFDRGPLAFEGSVFRGREPDEDRYALDMGALDSWSVRLWFRPGRGWALQGSHGYLHQPEQLEPGDQRRTNGSVSWIRQTGSNRTAVTGAVGRNVRPFSTVRAVLLELTRQWGRTFAYSRFEALSVETEILLFPQVVHRPHAAELIDPVQEFTAGVVRDVVNVRGLQLGVGGDVVFYGVPDTLQFTHDAHPVSYHVFLRVRPPARGGRMWDMTMGQPMDDSMSRQHGMTMPGPP